MTITYVGTATAVTNTYAAVIPPTPAGLATGDYVLVYVSHGNPAGAWGSQPSGWLRIAGLANARVYGRIWQAGDTMPTFTPSGGAVGDDVIAQSFAFRGVEYSVLAATGGQDTSPVQTNASAQNVAYPALTMPGDAHAAVMLLWKDDDATSYTTPAGWSVAAALSAPTAGNDASSIAYYQIQTTAASISSGSVTVTGGASAVSAAIMIYLRPAAAISAIEQPTWPTRVLVTMAGLTIGDSVEVYREVAGDRTLLRAGSSTSVTDTSFLALDAELPFGQEITYVGVVNGEVTYTGTPATYTLEGGKVAVTDALTGLAAEAVIQEWTSKTYERESTRFRVGARNIVVSGAVGQFTSQMTLYTETTSSADNLMEVLAGATGGTVQIRQPGGYDDTDSYVVVTRIDKTRYDVTDGADERRLFVLDVVETDPWSSALSAVGYTLADIANVYTGQTLLQLSNDYATLLALGQGIFE